ncbi:unnamed protein product [Urochloa decumbens]|uniref:Uncharacterized protein n=1 Tax=Urochloa decumbens TaxID=240449 RepID=A0ABC9G2F4_9POAL
MDAHTGFGMRLLVIEPAMGFGPARLVMAPAGVPGARLPAGVHAVPAAFPDARLVFASPRSSASADARLGFASTRSSASADARLGFVSPRSSASASRRGSSLVVGALRRGGRATATGFFGAGTGSNKLDYTIAAAVAGASSTTGRRGRGVVAIRAAPGDLYPLDDDDAISEPAYFLSAADLRSKRDIADWVWLARLQTTFEVAFDAGLLRSGRDLRRVLEAIGDINITAPCPPCSRELCLDRVSSIVGQDTLDQLLLATPPDPEDDEQFHWSAMASQSIIEGIQPLLAILHARIIKKKNVLHEVPSLPLCSSCPVIMKQLLKVLTDCSTIIESSKFKRPQNSIRFPMLEAHALALERASTISLDVYEEVCLEAPDEQWTRLQHQLRNRRITLLEQDIVMNEYMFSIGVADTEKVVELLEMVAMEVISRA